MTCDGCGKLLDFFSPFDMDGVVLDLCAGCTGEATAVRIYGPEAEVTVDWQAIRARKAKP